MRKVFSILLLFISNLLSAQNYSGQYPGAIHFYSVNGSNTLTTIKEDSNTLNGSELIRFPELLMRDVFNEIIVDTNCMFWGAQECLYKQDGPTLLGTKMISGSNFVKHFNFYGDSLHVRFDVPVGTTQTVFRDQDTNLMVKYFCLSKDTSTVFGVADSVIVFTVITTDSLSNLLTSDLSGDTIVYSKNTGLLNGFSFDYFPNTFSSIELKGIRNPDFGFIGLTYADIYDFQVGDIFEIVNVGAGGFYRKLYEILSRMDNINDVTYSFKVITSTAIDYPPVTYVLDTVFNNETYSKTLFIDQSISEGNYELDINLFNSCWQTIAYNYDYSDWCNPNYCPSADCFGSSDCFGSYFYLGRYLKGIGKSNETINYWGFSQNSNSSLSYFNFQGLECGSSYILSSDDLLINSNLSIFPNPSSDFITINSEQPIKNGTLSITDLSGRLIDEFNFSQSLQIDLSDYSNGVYVVKMISGDHLLSVQKFTKQ